MATYATNIGEAFASTALSLYFQKSVSEVITNQDYEGEIKDTTSKVSILTFGNISIRTYTGADMTDAEDPTESEGELVTDQKKAYYFKIPSLSKFLSYVKNPESSLMQNAADGLKEVVDAHVLGHYADAAAGQWDGTVYNTGTVTVANTTGVVTPAGGAIFSAGMVGKPFKAVGHSKWYRIKAYTVGDGTITIENDSDDETSAYDGGAIAGGTDYTIQANTAVQVTKANIYTQLNQLKTYLDKAKIPQSNRYCVMPADIINLLNLPDAGNPVVSQLDGVKQQVVENGYVGRVLGFDLYSNEQVGGDAVNGYHVLAGHKSAITFALGFTESGIEDINKNFGKAYKGLTVFGTKVLDERRKALAHGFWKL